MLPSSGNVMPIFYLNKAESQVQRLFMEQQFQQLGLTAERIEALCDGQVAEEEKCLSGGENLTRAEMARCYSHRLAWLQVAKTRQRCLVLEDNVVLTPALPAVLQRFAKAPLPWLYVRLGEYREKNSSPCFERSARLKEQESACGYLLESRGADLMLEAEECFDCSIDVFLDRYWDEENGLHVVLPWPVKVQRNFMRESALM